jgi:hopanoid biosynthesis associated RND transporter like protein HpnN
LFAPGSPINKSFDQMLAWWVDVARRRARLILALSLILTALSVDYALTNLGINTDTGQMFSDTLPWRHTYLQYQKDFPESVENLVLVLDGSNPDLVEQASRQLAQRLSQDMRLVKWVYRPDAGPFFEREGLLYLSPDELGKLSDNLAAIQPFLGRLAADPSLRGFAGLLGQAVDAVMVGGQRFDLDRVLDEVTRSVDAARRGETRTLSWQELMLGRTATGGHETRRFVIVKPKLDYRQLLPAGAIMGHIRSVGRELGLSAGGGVPRGERVRLRITGDIALAYEELKGVSRGAGLAAVLALILVGAVLGFGLRSGRLVLASLVALVVGLTWTSGFATVAVGRLNLISVAFAVLYIGLGVAYAIHFCLRYREVMMEGVGHAQALRRTAQDVGESLVLCAVTTGIGFFAFVPTSFAGVSELGIIAGTGMFISLLVTLTLLPALLTLLPLRAGSAPPAQPPGRARWLQASLAAFPWRGRRSILVVTVVLSLASLALLPGIRFDYNPLDVRNPNAESVKTYRDLMKSSGTSPWSAEVMVSGLAAAEAMKQRLEALPAVGRVLGLQDFVPDHQAQKLAIIDQMSLLLGPTLAPGTTEPPPTLAQQKAALAGLRVRLEQALRAAPEEALAPQVTALDRALDGFQRAVEHAADGGRALLERLQSSVIGTLPEQLRALRTGLQARPITVADLPQTLRERWVAPDGRYRVEVSPRQDLTKDNALQRFVSEVTSVAPHATDAPVVILRSGQAVVGAFQQAFLSALVLIVLLLVVLMRRARDVLMVLAPLLLASLLTLGTMELMGMPFNFANVIALPLLLGMGVDNGIHMVNRMHTAPPPGGNPLQTSTTRAIIVSALTTICSFGNLAFSAHRGMASMGALLTIGLAYTLICTLILLPVLLASGPKPVRH